MSTLTKQQISRLSQPPICRIIGTHIKEKRLVAGISQRELAERIGTQRPSISQIEMGNQKVAVHELLAIARVLNVEVTDLLLERKVLA